MSFNDTIDLKAAVGTATGGGVSSQRRDRIMTRTMYARHLETFADEALKQQMSRTCGPLLQPEIEALAGRLANLKTRYYSALLEVGKNRGLPQPEQFRELQALRAYCEELEAGFTALTREIEQGAIPVEGVTDPVY